MIYEENKNFTIPIAHIIMSNKSYYSYKKIFHDLNDLINEYNIKVNFKNIIINCDFEKSLIKAIREEFKEVKIYGCYFHYIKALWKKTRNLGFTKKKFLNTSKLIIFACKIYPFILKENKLKYIKEVYDYALKFDNKYNAFVKYFKKNWESSEFLNFDLLPNGDIEHRTNNIIEAFHHKLNSAVGSSHPRISILVEKLMNFSIEYYHKYVEKLFQDKDNKTYVENIFNDIYNFLEKFLDKYDKNININLLIQDNVKTKKDILEISDKILKILYNFHESNQNNELSEQFLEEEQLEKDEDISNDDLSENWWLNQFNKELCENEVDNNTININNAFLIDYEPQPKKRKYNDIKYNFIKKLFVEDVNEIADNKIFKKTLKTH